MAARPADATKPATASGRAADRARKKLAMTALHKDLEGDQS
jgi:hypothetical protein